MDKKGFTESQIILFVIIFGLAILFLVPIMNKTINNSKEKRYQKNINEALSAASEWLNDKIVGNIDNETTYYVNITDLVNQNYLSKEKISGCIKIVYQEKIDEFNYTYTVNNCKEIMSGKDIILQNIVNSGDGLYKEDNKYIYKGKNPNNYILINKVEYRILSLDSNGIRVVRNSIIEERSWDSVNVRNNEKNPYCEENIGCNAYVSNGNEITQDSEIHQYLETVYAKIDSKDIVLNNNAIWQIGTVENIDDKDTVKKDVNYNTITSNIGLLNIYDYISASISDDYTKDNWLNIGTSFWTLTSVKNSNNLVWKINKSGKIVTKSAEEEDGVRPVLNISSTINLLGSGTQNDPYILNLVK